MCNDMTLAVGDLAPDVVLCDYEEREVALASLWQQQVTLLVYVRHFGCPHCRAHATQLRRTKRKFDALGTQIVLVGMGTPVKADVFRAELDLPFLVLCDPDRVGYRRYGLLKMSARHEFAHLSSATRFIADSARYGVRLSPVGQDFTQLGGDFVVDTQGIVRFAFCGQRASDLPEISDLLAASKAAR